MKINIDVSKNCKVNMMREHLKKKASASKQKNQHANGSQKTISFSNPPTFDPAFLQQAHMFHVAAVQSATSLHENALQNANVIHSSFFQDPNAVHTMMQTTGFVAIPNGYISTTYISSSYHQPPSTTKKTKSKHKSPQSQTEAEQIRELNRAFYGNDKVARETVENTIEEID